MKTKIPQEVQDFLQKQFKLKSPKINSFQKHILDYFDEFIKFNDIDISTSTTEKLKYNLVFNLIKSQLDEIPTCPYKDCKSKIQFKGGGVGWTKGCCTDHSLKLTMLEKYGVESPNHLEESMKKKKETFIKNYGCDNPMKSKKIQKKLKDTLTERYGTDNIMKTELGKEKLKKSVKEKYGVEHYSKTNEFSEKVKKTSMEKYGVVHYSQTDEFKTKYQESCQNSYGVNNVFQADSVKTKIKETNLRLLSVENPMQSEIVKNKHSKTVYKNWGVEHYSQTPEYKEQFKLTSIENWGVNHPSQSNEIKQKTRINCFKKYGVYHPMHVPEIAEKVLKASFSSKEYIWKNGDISYCQGYEDLTLFNLEDLGYNSKDIKTLPSEMPKIYYYDGNIKKRYYPDIFIPKENLLIEVKSPYTFNSNIRINKLKFAAVSSSDYEFKLEIHSPTDYKNYKR